MIDDEILKQFCDEMWANMTGFEKTKTQIADLMIMEQERLMKSKSGKKDLEKEIGELRGRDFMEQQERKRQKQLDSLTDSINPKYEKEREFTSAEEAKRLLGGKVVGIQKKRTMLKGASIDDHTSSVLKQSLKSKKSAVIYFSQSKISEGDLAATKAWAAQQYATLEGHEISFDNNPGNAYKM